MTPARYSQMRLDNWEPRDGNDPRKLLHSWVTNPNRPWSIVFLGPAGTGKTHLATGVLFEYVGPSWWLDAAEVVSQLREEVRNGARAGVTPVETKLLDPRPILIDDFGCTRLTDFAHEQWTRALCYRYNHLLPTLITTNAEKLDAFDVLDPRVTSRLHEGLVITLTGRDRRAA